MEIYGRKCGECDNAGVSEIRGSESPCRVNVYPFPSITITTIIGMYREPKDLGHSTPQVTSTQGGRLLLTITSVRPSLHVKGDLPQANTLDSQKGRRRHPAT